MEDGANDGSGSDSEPSVDNIPTAKLFGKKGMNAVKDSKSLVAALRKAARKRRRIAEAAAVKRAKKRALEAEEAIAAMETTAAANAALSAVQAKDTKPILPGVSTGSFAGAGAGDLRRMYGQVGGQGTRERGGPSYRLSSLLTTPTSAHTTTKNVPSLPLVGTPRRDYGPNQGPSLGGPPPEMSTNNVPYSYDFGIPGILSPSHLNSDLDQVSWSFSIHSHNQTLT